MYLNYSSITIDKSADKHPLALVNHLVYADICEKRINENKK